MSQMFSNGVAFILEGETEKEFYLCLLEYLCKKHSATLTRNIDKNSPDIVYMVKTNDKTLLLKFNVVNTITQMPRAGNWFNAQCVKKYKMDWSVFLCYDVDDYKEDISKFYEGDWATLRSSLKKAKVVIDVAAAADIEDVMLCDLSSICNYLGCIVPASLRGRKGKIKLKNLFRDNGKTYHEGKKARTLIESLNMNILIESNLVPLKEIERLLFE